MPPLNVLPEAPAGSPLEFRSSARTKVLVGFPE